MNVTSCVNEIFSSLQGEGSYVGEKMTFVRFAYCKLGCRWCDTVCNPFKNLRVFLDGGNSVSYQVENPVGLARLLEIMADFNDKTIAVTGGEPLEQVDFLSHFLRGIQHKRRILLETNGIYHKEFETISRHVDIVSMDIKLPSSTGRSSYWDDHGKFLRAVLRSGKEIYIKIVVTSSTTDKDLNDAIKLLSTINRYVPVFLQPVSPTPNFAGSISDERLQSMKRLFGAWLPNVSVSHQMHKEWGIK